MLEALYIHKLDPEHYVQKNVLSLQLFGAIPRQGVNTATYLVHYVIVVEIFLLLKLDNFYPVTSIVSQYIYAISCIHFFISAIPCIILKRRERKRLISDERDIWSGWISCVDTWELDLFTVVLF